MSRDIADEMLAHLPPDKDYVVGFTRIGGDIKYFAFAVTGVDSLPNDFARDIGHQIALAYRSST